jgi:prepilin-type N-terminal cleavage/methylation domain-containing protein
MRKAFTLIELLVVITVVAILAAILFPVFARARENGRKVACISNLRQLGCAIGTYLQDYGDRYPYAVMPGNNDDQSRHPYINEVMVDYVRDPRLWICPSDTGEIFRLPGSALLKRTQPFHAGSGSSYSYMGIHSPVPVQYYGMTVMTISKIKQPSLSVLLYELRPWHSIHSSLDTVYTSSARWNVLYCDGHIAQRSIQQWQKDERDAFYE